MLLTNTHNSQRPKRVSVDNHATEVNSAWLSFRR